MTMPKRSSLQQALSVLPESEKTLSKDLDSPRSTYSRTNSCNSMASSKTSRSNYSRSSSCNSFTSSRKGLVSSKSSSSLQKELGRIKGNDSLEMDEQQTERRGKVVKSADFLAMYEQQAEKRGKFRL